MEATEFEKTAEQYKDTVYRIALNYCRSPIDADDITQNVLIRLLRYDGSFETPEHLRNWLIRVSVNESKRWLSSPYRRFTLKTVSYEESLAEQYSLNREESHLFAALMRLTPKYRITLYLYYYEEYSAPEIAQMLNVRTSSVTTRLQRGRARLKELLTETKQTNSGQHSRVSQAEREGFYHE